MFENGLEEFDDARATCEELLKEYKACETADYITYVSRPRSYQSFLGAQRLSLAEQGSTDADHAS